MLPPLIHSLAILGLCLAAVAAPSGLFASSTVPRESRVWVSDAGTTVTAEFVATGDGKVILRRRDGNLFEVPLQRLSESDREWVAQQVRPAIMGHGFDAAIEEASAEGTSSDLSQACEELARRFAHRSAESGLDGVLVSDRSWGTEGDDFGGYALRTMIGKWIRDQSIPVFEAARAEETEGVFRTLNVNLVANGEHADGYLALLATDPATGRIDYVDGLYVRLSGSDREILGLAPLTRDHRFLPKVALPRPDELAQLASDPGDKVFSFGPGDPPRGVEAGMLRLWLIQHLWERDGKIIAQESLSDKDDREEVILVRERPVAHSERPGVTMMEVSAVEAESGRLRVLTKAALVR